jgi:hypothetical protein
MTLRRAWLAAALALYLGLTGYQLGLPGLHYDEAREAGLNAMELIAGAPVTAFRAAGIPWGERTLPLMVQDYIGALNVYLAVPLLALTGVGVPNLRFLPVLTGLVALLLLERAVSEWRAASGVTALRRDAGTPISLAGLFAVTLLAVSPSYVFWARQGVFVTNLMLPFLFLCLWQGTRWLRTGHAPALVLSALAGGLALYAKLSAYWVVMPFALLAGGWWVYRRMALRRASQPAGESAPVLGWKTACLALLAFCVPLLPLLAFNWQTGGTLASIAGNLERSYYGVDNANIVANLPVRWAQVGQVLRGEQFWYLGAVYANWWAPWLALLAAGVGLWCDWRRVLPPLLLVVAVFAASLFTVSDLFVTHYVLLQPLVLAVVALALDAAGSAPTQPARTRVVLPTRGARRGCHRVTAVGGYGPFVHHPLSPCIVHVRRACRSLGCKLSSGLLSAVQRHGFADCTRLGDRRPCALPDERRRHADRDFWLRIARRTRRRVRCTPGLLSEESGQSLSPACSLGDGFCRAPRGIFTGYPSTRLPYRARAAVRAARRHPTLRDLAGCLTLSLHLLPVDQKHT